jgi:hypothetical protein
MIQYIKILSQKFQTRPLQLLNGKRYVSKDNHAHIKFLGKRGKVSYLSDDRTIISTEKSPNVGQASSQNVSKNKNSLDYASFSGKAWYGRPKVSDAEIDAILSGGATYVK